MNVYDSTGQLVGRCADYEPEDPDRPYWRKVYRVPGFLHAPVVTSPKEYRTEAYRLGQQVLPCVLLSDGQPPEHLPGWTPLEVEPDAEGGAGP